MKLVKCISEFKFFFTVFLKNRNISSNIKRSKVTDYAALRKSVKLSMRPFPNEQEENYK